jgi:hypothetical protein
MAITPTALFRALATDLLHSARRRGYTIDRAIEARTDVRSVASLQLINSIVKKWEPDSSDELADRAIDTFLQANQVCKEYVVPKGHPLLETMKSFIYWDVERHFPDEWAVILEEMDVGPGASIKSRGRNTFLEKMFLNPLTTTDLSLLGEYLSYASSFPRWCDAEKRRQSMLGDKKWSVVLGSKLSTVRKTAVTDRTICTEPSLNMLFQLAVGRNIDNMSKYYGYDKALQPVRNRNLAKLGSIDGSLCTIDLTSASDLINMKVLEEILHPRLWAALLDCRSPVTHCRGEDVELHMISSMGNGFTFSLMTYLFIVMLKSVCKLNGIPFQKLDDPSTGFAVFGDDIICPSSMYEPVCEALAVLGHTPNLSKSYSAGPFRESCGGDYFNGTDVRGVYARRLDTIQDRFSLINRLNRWSSRHGILLCRTIQLLKPPRWRQYAVPTDEADDSGIHCPVSCLSKSPKVYFPFKPRRKMINIFIKRSDILKDLFDNPDGVIIAASIGRLTSQGAHRRVPKPLYSRPKTPCPFWDRSYDLERHGLSYDTWKVVTYINLLI